MQSIDLPISIIVILVSQLVILMVQLIRYNRYPTAKFQLGHILLSTIFILYNCSLFLESDVEGIFLESFRIVFLSYYFFFIFTQILPIKSVNGKLLILLVGSILSITFSIIFDKALGLNLMTLNGESDSLIMMIYFCFGAVLSIFGKWLSKVERKRFIFSGLLLVISIIIISISRFFDAEKSSTNVTANLFFYLAFQDYFVRTLGKKWNIFFLIGKVSILDIGQDEATINNESGKLEESFDVELDQDQILENELIKEFNNILTEREREVAKLLLKGHSYQEIIDILNLKYSTVSTHASNIFNKTGTIDHPGFIYYWFTRAK